MRFAPAPPPIALDLLDPLQDAHHEEMLGRKDYAAKCAARKQAAVRSTKRTKIAA